MDVGEIRDKLAARNMANTQALIGSYSPECAASFIEGAVYGAFQAGRIVMATEVAGIEAAQRPS